MSIPRSYAPALAAIGAGDDDVPREVMVAAPFGQTSPDVDAFARWAGDRLAAEPSRLAALRPFDAFGVRLRAQALRALVSSDAARAAELAHGVPVRGPREHALGLGTIARMSALAAARTGDADDALLACAPLLRATRPVARHAALQLATVGLTEGPLGRRARALLEDALLAAIESGHKLGAAGQLGALLDPSLADLLKPGASDRTASSIGRIVDLVAVLGTLAAHREGLTQRLSSLALEVPPFVAPMYVVAFLTALGEADPGPYTREVHARLADAARDNTIAVRDLAIEALAGPARVEPRFVDLLVEAVAWPNQTTPVAAAFALAELGDVPDRAVLELEAMLDHGDPAAALAAARALGSGRRTVDDRLLAGIVEPLHEATARALARPDDPAAFEALLDAYTEGDPELTDDLDERLQPRRVLVDALRAMPLERSAAWLARFAAGEAPAIGELMFHALDEVEVIPSELAAAGPRIIELVEHGDDETAALAALLASRLVPDEPRLESLIFARTIAPISLIALGSLVTSSEDTSEVLLGVVDDPGAEHAALAVAALGRCTLGSRQAEIVTTALVSHLHDDDPLAEASHGALLELVERGRAT